MKNLYVLIILLVVGILGVGVGYLISEQRQSQYYNNPYQGYQQGCNSGFAYRGLFLDIRTNPDGTAINIDPHNIYSMGYHDGYYDYRMNAKYCDDPSYVRGYRAGKQARPY